MQDGHQALILGGGVVGNKISSVECIEGPQERGLTQYILKPASWKGQSAPDEGQIKINIYYRDVVCLVIHSSGSMQDRLKEIIYYYWI